MCPHRSRKAETFYWATIMFSQTLGTALGDWMADGETGLGWVTKAARSSSARPGGRRGGLLLDPLSRTFLFWAAFVLTRPLGATVGDFLDKPHANGGWS